MAYSIDNHLTAERYKPQQLKIVARLFPNREIVETPMGSMADKAEGTDCFVGGKRLALRVCTHWARERSGDPDILFRWEQDAEGEVVSDEWAKVIGGWGAWYLYCWRTGDTIDAWALISLDALRSWADYCRLDAADLGGYCRVRDGFRPLPLSYLRRHGCVYAEDGL